MCSHSKATSPAHYGRERVCWATRSSAARRPASDPTRRRVTHGAAANTPLWHPSHVHIKSVRIYHSRLNTTFLHARRSAQPRELGGNAHSPPLLPPGCSLASDNHTSCFRPAADCTALPPGQHRVCLSASPHGLSILAHQGLESRVNASLIPCTLHNAQGHGRKVPDTDTDGA